MRLFIIGSLILLFSSTCVIENKPNNDQLARSFYELNKEREFDQLFKLMIESREVKYDDELNKYRINLKFIHVYDSLHDDFVRIPLKTDSFENCSELCVSFINRVLRQFSNENTKKLWAEYADEILGVYQQVKVPHSYPYTNVFRIISKPRSGNIIEFHLSDMLIVYHIQGEVSSRWKTKLQKMSKLDDNWYFNDKMNSELD